MKVTAIRWNPQGNCVLYTRSDQQALDLLIFSNILPSIIAPGHNGLAREDKKWYKIEIAGIQTGLQDGIKGTFSSQQIHSYLCENNLEYAKTNVTLLPRWTQPPIELGTQGFFSIVFAVDDKDQHIHLLKNVHTLAAWGRIVYMHKWMDCPSIIQYRKYWKFGHYAANCKSTTKYHICHSNHKESQHIQACTECTNKTNMVIDGNNSCTYTNPSCINCKTEGIDDCAHSSNWTRCPIHLRKLGEACEQPRHM